MSFVALLFGTFSYAVFSHDISPLTFRGINDVFLAHSNQLRGLSSLENRGTRCGVITPPNEELDRMESEMRDNVDANNRAGLYSTVGGTVPVYFHVLMDSSNNGYLASSVINEQIDVLNNAFQAGGWSFFLANVAYITNNVWFTGMENDEVTAKQALRRGTGVALNFYTCKLSRYLGWAYFPSTYTSTYWYYDGVVVDYRSMPGGLFSDYNDGDTGEERSCESSSSCSKNIMMIFLN